MLGGCTGGDSLDQGRCLLQWATLGMYPWELLDGNKTSFWSLKHAYCLVLLCWCKRGKVLVFPLPPPRAATSFCVWTGILGLFIPYFNPSLSLLLVIRLKWSSLLLYLAALALVFLVLWVAVCNTCCYHSVFLSSKQDPRASSCKIFTMVWTFLFIYCKIREAQMASVPCTLASPAHAAQWYCIWLTGAL